MSMITIPKSELEQLEAAIKERDQIIAQQKDLLEVAEGYIHYFAVLFQTSQAQSLRLIREQHFLVWPPSGTPAEITRLERIADIDRKTVKHQEVLNKSISIWQAYLENHPHAKKILIGEYNLQLPPVGVA